MKLALRSKLSSTVKNSLDEIELVSNENRRLSQVETAEFLGGSGGT